jgi:phospholipid/cholesterol/gamma-HCH transport system permease protein
MMIDRFIGNLGQKALSGMANVNRASALINETIYWLLVGPFKKKGFRWASSIHQMVLVGFEAIPIVSLIALSVGIIMALQAAYQLRRVGALIYVADLVGISITRELGPLLTAIVLAGRSGSAFAAEIGSMKVAEEIDAMVAMGLNPVKFLVLPKIVGIMLMLPCLVLIADFVGIAGGFLIAVGTLQLGFERYFTQTVNALVLGDVMTGMIKGLVFALIIGFVGCHEGFSVDQGAESVGLRTTRSVVTGIFLIILADCFFTVLFYLFGQAA